MATPADGGGSRPPAWRNLLTVAVVVVALGAFLTLGGGGEIGVPVLVVGIAVGVAGLIGYAVKG